MSSQMFRSLVTAALIYLMRLLISLTRALIDLSIPLDLLTVEWMRSSFKDA